MEQRGEAACQLMVLVRNGAFKEAQNEEIQYFSKTNIRSSGQQ